MKTQTFTVDEWLAEGERRFGADRLKWRFVCPGCGHVQAVEDFRPFKDEGAKPESAYFNCIGRFSARLMKREWLGGEGPGPCNYTTGGLFNISPVTITREGERPVSAFAFAEVVAPAPAVEAVAQTESGVAA